MEAQTLGLPIVLSAMVEVESAKGEAKIQRWLFQKVNFRSGVDEQDQHMGEIGGGSMIDSEVGSSKHACIRLSWP